MGAYQHTNFAYQGTGLFAYQTTADVVAPTVVIYGGDDAPRKRKRRKERRELFHEIESTIHALLHPEPSVPLPEAESVPVGDVAARARRAVDELLVLAEGQHQLLQRAAAVRAELQAYEVAKRQAALEQDDEDALIWMF